MGLRHFGQLLEQQVRRQELVVVAVPLDEPVGGHHVPRIIPAIGAEAQVVGEFLSVVRRTVVAERGESVGFAMEDRRLSDTLDPLFEPRNVAGPIIRLEGSAGFLHHHARIAEQGQGLHQGDVVATALDFQLGDPPFGRVCHFGVLAKLEFAFQVQSDLGVVRRSHGRRIRATRPLQEPRHQIDVSDDLRAIVRVAEHRNRRAPSDKRDLSWVSVPADEAEHLTVLVGGRAGSNPNGGHQVAYGDSWIASINPSFNDPLRKPPRSMATNR